MSAEDELKEALGDPRSSKRHRPLVQSTGIGGPETPEERIAALEDDVQALFNAMLRVGRQIDDLRSEISRS